MISRSSRLHHNTQEAGSLYHIGHLDMSTRKPENRPNVEHCIPPLEIIAYSVWNVFREKDPLVNAPRTIDSLRAPSDEDRKRGCDEKRPVEERPKDFIRRNSRKKVCVRGTVT